MILAFVHLGTKIPQYLKENIKRSLDLFPEFDVRLICDSEVDSASWNFSTSSRFKIYKWTREDFNLSEISILHKLENESSFRGGYWSLTIERLFAIAKVFEESDEPVLHIESDVLLLPNFPISRFDSEVPPLIWGAAREKEDIAAIFFVANKKQFMNFKNAAFEHLAKNPKHTDMSLLYEIRKTGELNVGILPFLAESQRCAKDITDAECGKGKHFERFHGYFDIAPLGMWLTGIDPRNTYGFLVVRDSRQLELVGYYSNFSENTNFSLDSDGCLWSNGVPVFSLHIHSKQKSLFGNNWKQELGKFVTKSQSSERKIESFGLGILFGLIIQNLQKRSFLKYTKSLLKWIFKSVVRGNT